jgi:AI-2 transport protein TqsA
MSSSPSLERTGLTLFSQQLLVVVLSLLALVIVVYLLREFAVVLKPLFVAAFVGYLVLPAHHWLVKKGINPPLAAVTLITIVVGLFSGLGLLLYSNVETLVEKWPVYEQRFQFLSQNLLETMPKSIRDNLRSHAIDAQFASNEMRSLLGTFFSFFSSMLVVIIYLAFLLAERATLPHRLEHAFGAQRARELLDIFASISRAITEYISVKAFISLLGGLGTALILLIFGVDFALTWGTLAFLLNFIPYLGSLVATILPVLLAFVQLDSPWLALLIGVLLIVMQQFLGVLVEPRMAGTRLGVSPLLIILSLAFWGSVWGIVGMLLAVPLLMILKIVFENIPATKPVAALMGK